MKNRFHATRTSICPVCLKQVPADHVEDDQGVFLEKLCPEHGPYRSRIAADYDWFSGLGHYTAFTVKPEIRQTRIEKGCPYDCGECGAHRQKSVFFLFEITSRCNLNCPICLGRPNGKRKDITPDEMAGMIQTVLDYAGQPPILTMGGGEPTLHPDFFNLVHMAKASGIADIWVYTNGVKISEDETLARRLVDENLYIVLQWDGFDDAIYETLRGRKLLSSKHLALSHLKEAGARIGICPTITAGVNDHNLGDLFQFFKKDPSIVMLDIAVMAFVGKGSGFETGRESRITAQDILIGLEQQTGGEIRVSDFSPISFSNPECLQIAYLFALPDGGFIPLKRFLEPQDFDALIMNTPLIELNAEKEDVFRDVINRLWAEGKENDDTRLGLASLKHIVKNLFDKPLDLVEFTQRSRDLVKTVLVHAYMDGLNFDLGRTKMCISRTVQPDGRLIPTCAYNTVHRQ